LSETSSPKAFFVAGYHIENNSVNFSFAFIFRAAFNRDIHGIVGLFTKSINKLVANFVSTQSASPVPESASFSVAFPFSGGK
jgi:hypothetical protein